MHLSCKFGTGDGTVVVSQNHLKALQTLGGPMWPEERRRERERESDHIMPITTSMFMYVYIYIHTFIYLFVYICACAFVCMQRERERPCCFNQRPRNSRGRLMRAGEG